MNRIKKALEAIDLVKQEFGPRDTPICPITIEEKDLSKIAKKALKEQKFKTGFMKLLMDPIVNDPKSFMRKRLGTKDTVDGETWEAVIPISVEIDEEGYLLVGTDISRAPVHIALKMLPMERSDAILEGSIERNLWRETFIIQQMSDLLLNKNAPPSLPVFYGYYICPSASNIWTNLALKREIRESDPIKEFGQRALILLSELEDNDLAGWMKNVLPKLKNPAEQIKALVWSVFAIMTYLQINLKFVHLDLHLGNLLVRNTPPLNQKDKEYWEYKFKDTTFYVPNEGYLFILWDFYRSLMLNKDKPNEVIKRLLPEMRFVFGRSVLAPIAGKIALNIKENPEAYLPYVYAYDSYRFLNGFLNTIKRMNLEGVRLGAYYGMLNEAKRALVDDLPKKKLPAIRPSISEFPVGSPAYLFEKYLTKKEFKEKIKGNRINPQAFVVA